MPTPHITTAPNPDKKARRKKVFKIIGIIFAVALGVDALVALLIFLKHPQPAPPKPAASQPAPVYASISSRQLEAEYRADYKAADRKYTGKVLLIHAVAFGWNGSALNPALNLNGGYMEANFSSNADEMWIQTLHRGDRVDIICKVAGAESATFNLTDCQRAAGGAANR